MGEGKGLSASTHEPSEPVIKETQKSLPPSKHTQKDMKMRGGGSSCEGTPYPASVSAPVARLSCVRGWEASEVESKGMEDME